MKVICLEFEKYFPGLQLRITKRRREGRSAYMGKNYLLDGGNKSCYHDCFLVCLKNSKILCWRRWLEKNNLSRRLEKNNLSGERRIGRRSFVTMRLHKKSNKRARTV